MEGSWVPIQHKVAWAEAYLRAKWHLDPSSRLATIDMCRKLEGALPFWGGELGPHLTQYGLSQPRPTSITSGILIIQPFGHNRHGPKIGGGSAFLGRGSWVPIQHNVAWAEAYLHAKWQLDPSSRLATTDVPKIGGGSAFLGRGSWVPI